MSSVSYKLLINYGRRGTTRRFMTNNTRKETRCGSTTRLPLKINPRNYIIHAWTGPFKVVERIGETDYRVKELFGKKAPVVVHFDRLKPCQPGTRFPQQASNAETPEEETTISMQPSNVFELEIVEADDDDVPANANDDAAPHDDQFQAAPLRQSTRTRQQPERLLPVVTY